MSSNTKETLTTTALDLIWASSYSSISVDEICKTANVNKGSFYHYFPSKVDLALYAMEYSWGVFQPQLDHVFSLQKSGLTRLLDYSDFVYEIQQQKYNEHGFICGCPFTSLGSEQGTRDQRIREKVEEKLGAKCKYFSAAIRDAINETEIAPCDPDKKANELFCYYLGLLAQARITNNLECIKNFKNSIYDILGAHQTVKS